jgi:chromodomain-helicase-DNA-binding protein 4
MSDSEEDLNVDLSQWKTRTVNVAPEPPAPAPRTFAAINAPAAAPTTTNQLDDEDDFDIDAIIEGIADQDDPPESRNSTPPRRTAATRRSRQTVQVVITQDPNFNRDDYIDCTHGANLLRRVLKEITKNGDVHYNVEFVDRHTEQVSTFTTALLILPVVASEVLYSLTLPWLSHKPCIPLASPPLPSCLSVHSGRTI